NGWLSVAEAGDGGLAKGVIPEGWRRRPKGYAGALAALGIPHLYPARWRLEQRFVRIIVDGPDEQRTAGARRFLVVLLSLVPDDEITFCDLGPPDGAVAYSARALVVPDPTIAGGDGELKGRASLAFRADRTWSAHHNVGHVFSFACDTSLILVNPIRGACTV